MSSIRIEAESMLLSGGYSIENGSFAANGQFIGLRNGPTGAAATTFTGFTGFYDIVVGYYDEKDGESPFSLTLDGATLDSWTADTSPGGNRASARNFTLRTVGSSVLLTNGSSLLQVSGVQAAGENARFDYIEFISSGPANGAPTARSDTYTTTEDTALVTPVANGVLANDSAPETAPLNVSAFDSTSVGGGVVTMGGDGAFTFTPATNFTGADSFNYTVSDSDGNTAMATVTVNVSAVNDSPTATNDSFSTELGTSLTFAATDLLSNDNDVDGDSLSLSNLSAPSNGELSNNGDSTFTYTPDPGFTGTDSFSYTISDGNGETATGAVNIQVDSVASPNTGNGIILNANTGVALSPLFGVFDTPRLMPLGDSITAGQHRFGAVPGGYRIQFWDRAVADGLSIDFVGGENNRSGSLGDGDHEGHSGWRIGQLTNLVRRGQLSLHPAEAILLMAGTNDVIRNGSATRMINGLSRLIDEITDAAPNTQLLISSIPPVDAPRGSTPAAQKVAEFNSLLPDLISQKADQGKQVFYVDVGGKLTVEDLNGDNSATSDLNDGLHPTADGYDKLGDAWYDAVFNPEILSDTTQLIGSEFRDWLTGNHLSNVLNGGGGRG